MEESEHKEQQHVSVDSDVSDPVSTTVDPEAQHAPNKPPQKRASSLWSLSSTFGTEELFEVAKNPGIRKFSIALIVAGVVVVILIIIILPLAIICSSNKEASAKDGCSSEQFFNSSSANVNSGGCKPALCSEYSHGGVFKGDGTIPERYLRTVLNSENWLSKRDFNLTFTDETVGGLPVMGLNSSYREMPEERAYEVSPIKGVNLGGWLVLEPFITPSLFGDGVVDEWSLCDQLYQTNGAARVQRVLEKHYAEFITEEDFREIALAGLDHVRIPFGYWIVDEPVGTPYLPFVGWRYLLRGIEWARRYGLRVFLDLHAVPGSQNGWNHSGKLSRADWMNGTSPDGYKYGSQTLEIHRRLATFFSQERYRNLVVFYGLVNEPLTSQLGPESIVKWHQDAYRAVVDAGYPHNIVDGDGLMGPQYYNQGQFNEDEYPQMVLDVHQYMVFDKYLLGLPHGAKNAMVCHEWAQMLNGTRPRVMVGEWSCAVNDCGTYVNNVGGGTRWEGNFTGNTDSEAVSRPLCAGGVCTCANVNGSTFHDPVYRAYLRAFALNQMTVYENNSLGWTFWTWKTEDNPQWSLRTLMHEGLINLSEPRHCDDTTNWLDYGLSESI